MPISYIVEISSDIVMWYLCQMIFFSITCRIRSYCFLKKGCTKHSKLNKSCTIPVPNWSVQTALYLITSSTKDMLKLKATIILQSWHRFLTNYKTPWLSLRKTKKKKAKKCFSLCAGFLHSIDLTIRTKLQSANLDNCQGKVQFKWTTSSTQGSPVSPAHTYGNKKKSTLHHWPGFWGRKRGQNIPPWDERWTKNVNAYLLIHSWKGKPHKTGKKTQYHRWHLSMREHMTHPLTPTEHITSANLMQYRD